MKTISIAEFKSLVARNEWQRQQDDEIINRIVEEREVYDNDTQEHSLVDITHVYGLASKASTLNGVTISYIEGFNYDECDPDSLTTGTEGQDDVWSVEGVVVVDEYGDELNAHELAGYLDSDFSSIDYSVLEIEQVTDIDADENSDMKTFTLEIDNAPSVRFTGELVASAASSDNQAMGSSYSGQTGRWTELALYKTKGGKFVCHQVGRTNWQGERDRFSGKVCESPNEVKDFFGYRWLAKELYNNAGIDASTTVDEGYQSFYLSPVEIEAAQYYVNFGCPKLAGVPEFSEINSDLGEPVTHVDETDFTKDEYAKLELGEASVEKLSELIAKLIQDDTYDGERLKNILF